MRAATTIMRISALSFLGLTAAAASSSSSSSSSASSHVVSSTDARLPMSLSTVIQDLEAEGASYVTTAAFLTSKSVRRSEASRLLRSLFGVTGDGDHDGEVIYGTTTAFGKKFDGDDIKNNREEKGADDEEEEEEEEGEGGSGVAIACPPCSSRHGATASEVSSTVVACGGTVVYVADAVDLGRGEGLFDYLGPALERLLAFRASTASERRRPSTLLVVFRGIEGGALPGASAVARRQFESAASQMLASIIPPPPPPPPVVVVVVVVVGVGGPSNYPTSSIASSISTRPSAASRRACAPRGGPSARPARRARGDRRRWRRRCRTS